ncbi:MAG: ribosomal protein S18-alanine N-acetyltransferase [Clostridia bacterium]|nr:ribosomal protein S18-alanine N-acetyltransferase [Clostridia bacterium]
MNLTFRPWTIKDTFFIAKLCFALFIDAWDYGMVMKSFRSERFIGVLVEDDGIIVGFACGTTLFEEGEVDLIAVKEEYRKKGLGKQLLSCLEQEAKNRGAERTSLEVRVSNVPALLLYLNGGYRSVKVRKKYYADGEDAVIMEKKLN